MHFNRCEFYEHICIYINCPLCLSKRCEQFAMGSFHILLTTVISAKVALLIMFDKASLHVPGSTLITTFRLSSNQEYFLEYSTETISGLGLTIASLGRPFHH